MKIISWSYIFSGVNLLFTRSYPLNFYFYQSIVFPIVLQRLISQSFMWRSFVSVNTIRFHQKNLLFNIGYLRSSQRYSRIISDSFDFFNDKKKGLVRVPEMSFSLLDNNSLLLRQILRSESQIIIFELGSKRDKDHKSSLKLQHFKKCLFLFKILSL